MQFFLRNLAVRPERSGSSLAFALALATGTVLGATAMATPAYAAKKEKKAPASKANYSKAFIEAYKPLEVMSKAEPKDNAGIAAAIPGLVAAVETPDDRFAAGNLIYNAGLASKTRSFERQGVDMMIESGKVPAEAQGSYLFLAGQLAYQDGDWATARTRMMAGIAAGYTANDPEAIVAEAYFADDKQAEGLAYLADAINKRAAAGQTIDENWLKRGISVAYKSDMAGEATRYSSLLVKYYPNQTSWGDAIAIQRNMLTFDNQEMLDLLRLADRTGSMRSERDYVDYADSADARRLPGEVSRIIEAGIVAGKLNAKDIFVSEVRAVAKARIAADQADLPALERDARKPGSTALTATAAGDAFLSYGKNAQAEEMYSIALTKPGADTQRVLTRLGIAQVDQGKTADAKATFAKIEGNRKSIANLWTLYADQKAPAPAPAN